MSPIEFENYCSDYLRLKGWNSKTTKGSGDQGIDVIACKSNVLLVIQCKLYSSPIGNSAVQEVFAGKAFLNAHAAAVVSNQTYTKSAIELSKKTGVLLLHFKELSKLEKILGIS